MRSEKPGQPTSDVEVTNVSSHGFWLLWNEKELFLSFEDFPWFRDATIAQISRIELLHGHHLHWPELDVDLSFDVIERPQDFPLVSQRPAKV